MIYGGPFNSLIFEFLQFHMHWGETIMHGSEHKIDHKAYAAEVFAIFLIYKYIRINGLILLNLRFILLIGILQIFMIPILQASRKKVVVF